MARQAAIGIEDFGELIESGCFYIDKTCFIKEWWENRDKATLITRPRRFGKTLAMSMVEHFFSVKHAGRGSLFEKLSIWEEEAYRKLQGTYPVISLSFSNVKEKNFADARKKICQILADLYTDHKFLIREGFLDEEDVRFFRRVSVDMDAVDASLAIYYLTKYLSRYYGKKAIVLLDEYDTPMQEACVNGYWDDLAGFLRGIMGSTLKGNPYLERGLMTGITRISKESLFSGLNNLKAVTVTSQKYETIFGFTENEVIRALEEFHLEHQLEDVRNWYDGYRFGNTGSIYNPWSIINFLDEGRLAAYWSNTSSNKLAGELIQKGAAGIKQSVEDLLNGKTICADIDEEIVYDELNYKKNAVWGLLLASGYLRADGFRANRRGKREYLLALTNLEVREVFDNTFAGWLDSREYPNEDFSEALLAGDLEAMNRILNDVLVSSISYYDGGTRPSKFRLPENFYHGLVLGLIASLRGLYAVTSNRESGFGRYDVMLEPLKSGYDAMILEFKVYDGEGQGLDAAVDAALRQIIEKDYAALLEAKGISKDRIRIYGFAFEGKTVLAGGGRVETRNDKR